MSEMGLRFYPGNQHNAPKRNSFGLLNLYQKNSVCNPMGEFVDLIFSDVPITNLVISIDPFVPCDVYHPTLVWEISSQSGSDNNIEYNLITLNCRRANFELLLEILEDCSMEEATSIFYSKMNEIIQKHVPKTFVRKSGNTAWIPANYEFCSVRSFVRIKLIRKR
jgi:hypothetical protein